MGIIGRGYRFLRYNEHKSVTLKAWVLSAYYRFQMLYEDTRKLNKKWGIEGEESAEDVSMDEYRYCKKVSYAVNQVCSKTRWESKCLVRALTAQKLLAEKGIESTMYLGVKEDGNHKMVAHSWIRVGKVFVTGGNGVADGYAVVDKFRSRISKKR
ncbi:lasso peptide biosynthesis B2 protein [Butyrivibrio sp. INlla14]|uniref:lasso peptide biosynthesis B2 protein n=1 Tax=Butyrivibrio sp. INlla14 TaxID=1520808 RepID=UPI00087645FB|nr:lasso peptide biosynthesis B2 protein [Butyrivibrio sp. INlla14]SCY64882.1 Transglutaminase-like superfamily protein [Butyrivibrio sp. INlla14]